MGNWITMQLFKSNIPEVIERLEQLKTAVGGNSGGIPTIPDFSDAMLSALNAGMGKMKNRIFNKGLDADGNSFGNYHGNKTRITKGKLSVKRNDEFDEKERKKRKRVLGREIKENPEAKYTEYEKFRVSHGRQIVYKDLEMEGSLRRSIETVRQSNKSVVVAIINEETADISTYQEKQIGNIRAGQNANTGSAAPARIFEFSKEELEQVEAEAKAAIKQTIDKILQ
jgi:hypothetical protein